MQKGPFVPVVAERLRARRNLCLRNGSQRDCRMKSIPSPNEKWQVPPFREAARLAAASTYVRRFQWSVFSWKASHLLSSYSDARRPNSESVKEAGRTKQAGGTAGRRTFMWCRISLRSSILFKLKLDAVGGEVQPNIVQPVSWCSSCQVCDVLTA